MSISSILSLLTAIFKAIPVLKGFWDEMVTAYINSQIATMKKENREAIRKAIYEQDQRDIESAIGSPTAGEQSGLPGAVVVDELPGVMQDPK